MKGKDTIAAKMAECFITIGDRRYNFMQMIDMEVQVISLAVWKVLFPAQPITISL